VVWCDREALAAPQREETSWTPDVYRQLLAPLSFSAAGCWWPYYHYLSRHLECWEYSNLILGVERRGRLHRCFCVLQGIRDGLTLAVKVKPGLRLTGATAVQVAGGCAWLVVVASTAITGTAMKSVSSVGGWGGGVTDTGPCVSTVISGSLPLLLLVTAIVVI
jgi:hypothetical protein